MQRVRIFGLGGLRVSVFDNFASKISIKSFGIEIGGLIVDTTDSFEFFFDEFASGGVQNQ